jgi:hypothetical protein
MKYRSLACAIVICLLASAVFADIPLRIEELIYSIDANNGMHFSKTFCREESDMIYLLERTNNFLLLRKTFVYFWPLTEKWMTDTDHLNETFDGMLEIEQDGRLIKKLPLDVFLYYNEPGDYENNWKVFLGTEAMSESERIEKLEKEFRGKMQDYQQKYELYEKVKAAFIQKMEEYREGGRDTSDLLERFKQLEEPTPPKSPSYQELNGGKQFIVNLPAGEYSVRMRRTDGLVLQGSDKKLVVYGERRQHSVGYDIVPSDKWTMPVASKVPSNVIYVDGTVDLYMVPFEQKEFNELYYNKTIENGSRGNMAVYRWEKIREVPFSRIEKTSGLESEVILEQKYIVEPMKSGVTPGYKILEYDPEGAHKYKNYSFKGFHIPIDRSNPATVIKLQNSNGVYYPLSEREIRIVIKSGSWIPLGFLVLVPLVVMLVVLIRRNAVYTNLPEEAERS